MTRKRCALPRAARPFLNDVLEGCKSKKLDEAFFASGRRLCLGRLVFQVAF